jgi:putative ABC transport system permease protein
VLPCGLQLVAVGLVVGLLASIFLTRLIQAQLFGVGGREPVAYASVAGLLLLIAAAACYVPARRATKLDPAAALRHE